MRDNPHNPTTLLEKGARSTTPLEIAAQVSIAISLKRIADALNDPNDHGEVGSAALAGAIYRGLKNI